VTAAVEQRAKESRARSCVSADLSIRDRAARSCRSGPSSLRTWAIRTRLDRLIHAGYKLLDLITYFTAGVQEVRAWTIRRGTKAPGAAGVIHSDFEKGFIKAIPTLRRPIHLWKRASRQGKGPAALRGKDMSSAMAIFFSSSSTSKN